MSRSYTQVHLGDLEDVAPANGFGHRWEARVARVPLESEETGIAHFRLRPGKRSRFAPRHRHAEEVYVVLSGDGRMKLDDQLIEVWPLDAIRVAPDVVRALEAGPNGLEFLAFGPHHEGDGESVQDPCVSG